MSKDLYEVLDVPKSASKADIKKAYRRKAMKLHPDRNKDKDTSEEFKQVQRAYDVLSDENKRTAYDQFGEAGINGSAAGGGHQGFGEDFSDIFSSFFGGGGSRRQRQRGSDLQYDLSISLEEAFHGKEVKIKLPVSEPCGTCSGTGASKGEKPQSCTSCHGSGQVRINQGFINIQQTCPTCRGQGQVIRNPCAKCGGTGTQTAHQVLAVKVPAGIDNGQSIRIQGKGEPGPRNTPSGDLYVQVHVKPHKLFERNGADLYCEAPIDIVTATLGGSLEVPTLGGKVKLTVPEGTQSGKTFRLRGKGITSIGQALQGDLYCRVVIETPVNLNGGQKEIFQKLRDALKSGVKHSPRQKSFMDSLKNFFNFGEK